MELDCNTYPNNRFSFFYYDILLFGPFKLISAVLFPQLFLIHKHFAGNIFIGN